MVYLPLCAFPSLRFPLFGFPLRFLEVQKGFLYPVSGCPQDPYG